MVRAAGARRRVLLLLLLLLLLLRVADTRLLPVAVAAQLLAS